MKGGGHLFCILFLGLAWIEPILSVVEPIQLDFENICHHQFAQGCPVHDSDSWKCAKLQANCSADKSYHCIRNTTGQPFTVIHICAPLLKCNKGTVPVYDMRKGAGALSCEMCQNGFYQPADTWSDETPECLQKHKCEEEGNKIECDMGTGLSKTQDVYCQCDAKNNYVLINFEIREKCVEWAHATCYLLPCPGGQERLSNYSCGPQCDKGQKRDDNDICVSILTGKLTTTPVIDNMTFTDEASTKTTRATPLSPTTVAETLPVEIISGYMIAITVMIVILSVASLIGVFIVCWKCNILKKCKWSRKPKIRRQSSPDAHDETELKDMTQEPKVVINIENLQIGKNNEMNILKSGDQAVTNGDAQPAESNSSSAGNEGMKAHVDKEKGPPNVNPPECPGNFRSIRDETDAVYNLGLIVEVAKSVGIIRSPGIQGTGFRVGGSYIMTALHVVSGIINSVVPPVSHREGERNLEVLEDPNVHIDFDYSLPNDTLQHGPRSTQRFNFEPIICYENEILDTVVLKLKRGMWKFPCQLTRFGHCLMNLPMSFVGHSEGKVKQSDRSKPREDITSSKIQECQAWSKRHPVGCRKVYRGYEGAENPSKILFDCTFSKGASGSPGFIISSHNHMPYIVTMLLCGYPDWLYDERVSDKEKTCIQDGYTFEQGVRLTEVYNDMKVRNPELCLEIFGP
ncbi:hypothetical protein CHS0354_016701 [Potamilus streckersoni]|uniref:Uncharacterized protein n=1 Tax=Potamilus streckersoni TaxID=2493646 RepID=A0AAE0TID1_9BIVA|nr:hypothetical protein CHS0354_016701 [Potamilus streckersoni]